jgi:RNA polymerase sigma-70 factor, ECF subfamily
MQDGELIDDFLKSGNPERFRELVERYQDRVFRLVASVLGPTRDRDAEDVAQEVFLQVYRQLASFRREAQFGTWLYRIAYRRALDYRSRAHVRLPHVPDAVLSARPDDALGPLDDTIRGEDRERIAAAIERLPDLYRTIVYLYYWQDCPLDEIAAYTGVPSGTIKSYLARARSRLRGT